MGVQVLLFCFGFIFPFAWMIGAFLPLPPNPRSDTPSNGKASSGKSRSTHTDTEKASTREASLLEGLKYENARWWRSVNRIMSIVGLLLIGAVVSFVLLLPKHGP